MKRAATGLALAVAATIAVGATALGVSGTIGNEVIERDRRDDASNLTIADTNNPAPFDGTIESVDFYAKEARELRFVIVDDETNVVTYVSDEFVITQTGPQTVDLGEVVGVTQGDYLGVYSQGQGVVAFDLGLEVENSDFSPAIWQFNTGIPVPGTTELLDRTGNDFAPRVYSMQATVTAASPHICKNGGWETYGYENQGRCIASVVANENAGKE